MTTVHHHPTEETLIAFTSSTLDEGNSLVVAAHLAHCEECRQAVRELTEIGGSLLEQAGAVAVAVSARRDCMSKLDNASRTELAPAAERISNDRTATLLSVYMGQPYASGKWRWLGPGVYQQNIDIPNETGTRVFLLKAAPGTRLPDHEHIGTEWTCVLKGAFIHDGGRFGPGDFDEADGSVDHNPQVEDGEECICLVAMNGRIAMKSWLGRIIQPLVRF